MPKAKTKRPCTETQIYRDATMLFVRLTEVVRNLPRFVQFSVGEMTLKDACRVVQLMKLCYEASLMAKKVYMHEAMELMSCLEVTVNLLLDGRYINLSKKAQLYEVLGSIQQQLRAWMEKVGKQEKEGEKEEENNENDGE